MPPLFSPRLARGLALTLLLAGAVASCDSQAPQPPPSEPPVPGDTDGDGFAPPEDCFDGPFAWASLGAGCADAAALRFVPSDGARANDFTLAEHAGRLHVVHIRMQGPWWLPGNAVDFGHEITVDLQTWKLLPPIELRGRAGTWNDRNVWAPHLVRAGDRWALFYTGVTYADDPAFNRQRIGLAFSRDLRRFDAAPSTCAGVEGDGCVLDGAAPWTTWNSGEPWAGDCRDPFVAPAGDGWVMLLTVRLTRAGRPQAIARALSPDLLHWRLVDVIESTVGPVAESAALLPAAGGQLLMWTSELGQRWAWAPDALGPFSSPLPAPGGYACETLPLADGSFLFASVRAFGIDLQRLRVLSSASLAEPAREQLILQLDDRVAPACRVPGAHIHPGLEDPRNGLDDNCDGLIDAVRPPQYPPHDRGRPPRVSPSWALALPPASSRADRTPTP